MDVCSRALGALALALAVTAAAVVPAAAQNVTTGTLSGTVVDDQGGVLPGADVAAVHVPTGTNYNTVTQGDGRFVILNVRVGGPYSVTVTLPGFKAQTQNDATVALGEETALEFKLPLESVQETVNVTAESNPIFSGSKAGTSSSVATAAIESLPTISRTIEDFARLSPHFTPTPVNAETANAVSVAGRNTRYNSFQIDGAVNNDLFGLSDTGTPGGPAGTQPVSLDAIAELQLVVTPYDVRQGGFSGGGINAVTRSGSNDLHGTGYYFFRDQGLVGDEIALGNNTDGVEKRSIATFSDKQFGGSVGGPIVRNKTFFFTNLDYGRRKTPSGFSADGSSGQTFAFGAEAQRFRNILQNRYGYDPGGLSEFIRKTENNKFFVRSDVNMGRSQIIVRHNYVDAYNDIGRPDTTTYFFPSFFYSFKSKTNSTVAQLNSTFGTLFNEFRFSYARVRDNRGGQEGFAPFPRVDVRLPDGISRLRAGTENFSTANELDQDVYELTNDVTWVRGSHTLTLGTHNEFFKFRNLFIRDNFGNYEFANLDLFEQGIAGGFDHSFSVTGDPRLAARFRVRQFGVYAGDQWRLRNNVTVTYGVRVDTPAFPDRPTRNPLAEQFYGYRTDEVPGGPMWSPRAGFNWDLSNGGERQQVRGGVGIFAGRTPYVWLSNQFGNTGIEFRRLRVTYNAANSVAFIADPNAQPTTVGAAATNEIDLINPDYTYPQLFRSNLAYDRDLGFWGLIGTGEFLYSKTLKDIDYQNLNLVQVAALPDGRPSFVNGRVNRTFSDIIFLTNTDEGRQWSLSGRVERPFRNNVYISGSYVYGRAKSVSDGTSSQAASNWGNVYVTDPNHAALATSNFEVRHRLNVGGSYDFRLFKGTSATASLYYNAQIGRPYSIVYDTDVNGDGRFTNDLWFVPANPGDVIVRNGTWEQLDAFIRNDDSLKDYRGTIVPRNAGNAPWTHSLDFRLAANLPFKSVKGEITFDLFNMLNLLNGSWGLVEYANFNGPTVLRPTVDAATGKYVYDLTPILAPSFRTFQRDDLRSRWQGQLGFRLRF